MIDGLILNTIANYSLISLSRIIKKALRASRLHVQTLYSSNVPDITREKDNTNIESGLLQDIGETTADLKFDLDLGLKRSFVMVVDGLALDRPDWNEGIGRIRRPTQDQ